MQDSPAVAIDDELARRLLALDTNDVGFVRVLRELVRRMALLTLWVQDPALAEQADLDEMLEGLEELETLLARIGEFLPDIGE